MSLYREAGRGGARTLATVGVVAALVGGGIGYALGHSSAPEPSAAQVVAHLRSDLRPVASGLELIPGEYAQAYRGEGVELEGVKGTVARMQTAYLSAAKDVRTLDPAGAQQLSAGLDRLATAVSAKAPPAQVEQLTRSLSETLQGIPGGR